MICPLSREEASSLLRDAGVALGQDDAPQAASGGQMPGHKGEPRWAMAVAVLAAELLHLTLPSQISAGGRWIYPVITVGLLLVLVIGDPGRINNRTVWLRVVTSLLIASITIANAFNAIHLVELIVANAKLGTAGPAGSTAGRAHHRRHRAVASRAPCRRAWPRPGPPAAQRRPGS